MSIVAGSASLFIYLYSTSKIFDSITEKMKIKTDDYCLVHLPGRFFAGMTSLILILITKGTPITIYFYIFTYFSFAIIVGFLVLYLIVRNLDPKAYIWAVKKIKNGCYQPLFYSRTS